MEVSSNSIHSSRLDTEGCRHGLKGAKASNLDVGDDLPGGWNKATFLGASAEAACQVHEVL